MSSDLQVTNTPRTSADNLAASIGKLEADLAKANADLSRASAIIGLFEAPESRAQFPMHQSLDRLLKRRETPVHQRGLSDCASIADASGWVRLEAP